MIYLTSKEAEKLAKALSAIGLEAQKPIQRKNRIYNMISRAMLIMKKAKRRQSGTLELF